MSETPPRVQSAAKDRRLSGDDLRVYIKLQAWLSPTDFLPVRAAALAFDLYGNEFDPRPAEAWQAQNVAKSMRRLVQLGYLVRGPDQQSQKSKARRPLKTYLLQIPVPKVVTGTTSKAA